MWKLDPADEEVMSKALPADEQRSHRQQPWLLHSLDVNTLNFCSFAMCETNDMSSVDLERDESGAILIAVPSALDSDGVSPCLKARRPETI